QYQLCDGGRLCLACPAVSTLCWRKFVSRLSNSISSVLEEGCVLPIQQYQLCVGGRMCLAYPAVSALCWRKFVSRLSNSISSVME
ncbi:hypothetical protein ACJMK2_002624, partial [Sinanodonta woodiana]